MCSPPSVSCLSAAVCFLKIHARPLEGTRLLQNPDFYTPAMKSSYGPLLIHTVVKSKHNHKKLCELLQMSFFLFSPPLPPFFFFFLPPVSGGAHPVWQRTTSHHYGVRRFLKAGTLHWVGYSLLCKVLVFKGWSFEALWTEMQFLEHCWNGLCVLYRHVTMAMTLV